MLDYLKESIIGFVGGMPYEEILFIASLLCIYIISKFRVKLIQTGKLLLKGLGEILATIVVTPVTIIVVTLDILVSICTVALTICTGVITAVMLTLTLFKDLLQDLTTYIVDNYGREFNDR